MKLPRAVCLSGITILLSINSLAQAGLIGSTVSVQRETVYGFLTGPFTFVAEAGPLDTVALSTGNNHYFNVEDDRLEFTYGPAAGGGGPFAPWEHFVTFQDLSPSAPAIASISYLSNLPGFQPTSLKFTAHSVMVDQCNLLWSGGEFLTVNLQFVPEPSSALLIGIAICCAVRVRLR